MADRSPPTSGARASGAELSVAPSRPLSLAFGLLLAFGGVVFISFFVHWYEVGIFGSDWPPVTTMNALGPIALFLLFLVVAALNPLLRRVAPWVSLGRRELLLIASRVLSTAGNTFGPGVSDKAVLKNKVRDYLNADLYLPDSDEVPAATEYYQGRSYDNKTRVHALPRSPRFRRGDILDLAGLARKLRAPNDPLSRYLAGRLSTETLDVLGGLLEDAERLPAVLLDALNALCEGPSLYAPGRFRQAKLPGEMSDLNKTLRALERLAQRRVRLRKSVQEALRQPEDLPDLLGEVRRLGRLERKRALGGLSDEARAAVRADRDRVLASVEARLKDSGQRDEVIGSVRDLIEAAAARQDLRGEVLRIVRESPRLERLRDPFGEKQDLLRLNRRLLEAAYTDKLRRVPPGARRPWSLETADVADLPGLARALVDGRDAVSAHLRAELKGSTLWALRRFLAAGGDSGGAEAAEALRALVNDLNRVLVAGPLYAPERFAGIALGDEVRRLLAHRTAAERPPEEDLARLKDLTRRLNRLLLELAYPRDLAPNTLGRATPFVAEDLRNPARLARRLMKSADPTSRSLRGRLPEDAVERLRAFAAKAAAAERTLVADLNAVMDGGLIYREDRFRDVVLTSDTRRLRRRYLIQRLRANRRLLVEAFPGAVAPAAEAGEAAQTLAPDDLVDLVAIGQRLQEGADPPTRYLASKVRRTTLARLRALAGPAADVAAPLLEVLNRLLERPLPYDRVWFEARLVSDRDRETFLAAWAARVHANRLILQAAWAGDIAPLPEKGDRSALFQPGDVQDLCAVARRINAPKDPVSRAVAAAVSAETRNELATLCAEAETLAAPLVEDLNRALRGPPLYIEQYFESVPLPETVWTLLRGRPTGEDLVRLNRLLLAAAFARHLAPAGERAALAREDVRRPSSLLRQLLAADDAFARMVRGRFDRAHLARYAAFVAKAVATEEALSADLNRALEAVPLPRAAGAPPSGGERLPEGPEGAARARLNRLLLETCFPDDLRPSRGGGAAFVAADLLRAGRLARRLYYPADPANPAARAVREVSTPAAARVREFARSAQAAAEALAADWNAVLEGEALYATERFAGVKLSRSVRRQLERVADTERRLNRRLIEEGYPEEVARLPASVPWGVWLKPLAFWGALMVVFVVFSMSLVRMTHRQWSQHELLTYPIAGVADSLVGIRRGRLFPEVFYERPFWIGFGVMVLVFTINGLALWYPQMVKIPIYWSHINILKEFTFLSKYCGREAYAFFRGWFYPFMIALAALLPTEISLSCWLGWALMVMGTGFYFLVTTEVITAYETGHIQNGMQVAMALAILFIGRREYLNMLRCALFLGRPPDEGLRRARNACRVFLLAFAAMVVLLRIANLDWFLAVVSTLSFGLVVLLVARMTAEVGHPWLSNFAGTATWLPLKVLGAATLGPQGLAVMASVGGSLDFWTTNMVAAQQTTVEKLREGTRGRFAQGGVSLVLALGVLLALGATTFFTLWENHSFGAKREGRAVYGVKNDLRQAANHINRLRVEVGLKKVERGRGLGRLRHFKVEKKYWRFFLMGAALVGLCAFMRLRFAWWPFHPLPLLFINTWAMSRTAFPIMLGWLIKVALLKIWGGKVFARSKPFFYGVIVGQVVMTGVWVAVATVYFLVNDAQPRVRFNFFY